MLGVNGGLLGLRKVPTTGSASGLWFQNEQSLAQRAGIWPVVSTVFTRYVRFASFANTALDSNTLDLTETRFFNGPTTLSGITCTSSFSGGGTWYPEKLVDGDTSTSSRSYRTSWSSFQASATIDFDFGSAVSMTDIEIFTAFASSAPRFPASFGFQTSSDGVTYTTIKTLDSSGRTSLGSSVFTTGLITL